MKKILRIWLIIFVIILVWCYFLFISPLLFNRKTYTIPSVIDMTEEEACNTLKKAKIKYKITYIDSTSNLTIKTIPYAGTKVKANYAISLYIGRILPNSYKSYLGQIYENIADEIELMCKNNHLTLKIEYEENNDVIEGMIIKESLIDGNIMNAGDELCLTLAKNDNSYFMPNLVGLTIDEALKIIEEYKLSANINYYETPIEEDIILYQSTTPGTIILKGNPYTLDIYVSKGLIDKSHVNVDNFITAIENLGYELEVHTVFSNESSNKLVAFSVQKLYDINVVKYILWITE